MLAHLVQIRNSIYCSCSRPELMYDPVLFLQRLSREVLSEAKWLLVLWILQEMAQLCAVEALRHNKTGCCNIDQFTTS